MRSTWVSWTILLVFIICTNNIAAQEEENAAYWNNLAQKQLKDVLGRKPNTNVAKNVIFFLGDGMGVSTVTAGRILKGQLKGKSGEEENLVFDKFPYMTLVKTYNVDRQTPDSAGTGTAFLCGIKANAGTVGVDYQAKRTNCTSQQGAEVDSILRWSKAAGKSVGVVTTTRISHATPAASYAHSAERDWEGDAHMSGVTGGCDDISLQLIKNNKDINVILGGGRRTFIPVLGTDPILGLSNDTSNNRKDGKNLIKDWIGYKKQENARYKVLYNNSDVASTDPDSVDYILGLFATSHLSYELERDNSSAGQPSIAEMTELAINVLKKNNKGFFLLVEGGRIDHAHHDSKAKKALHEVVAFDKAVEKAMDLTSEDDTLIVVTADHSHVFVIGGYPTRGNRILGLNDHYGKDPIDAPTDGKPSTTLLYGNGPGHNTTHPRQDLTGVDTEDNDYIQQSAIPMKWETHGAEDVGVYALGPMAHLFQGVQEQNYIAHVMAYASCVGANKDHCNRNNPPDSTTKDCSTNSQDFIKASTSILLLSVVFTSLFAR